MEGEGAKPFSPTMEWNSYRYIVENLLKGMEAVWRLPFVQYSTLQCSASLAKNRFGYCPHIFFLALEAAVPMVLMRYLYEMHPLNDWRN